MVQKVDDQVKNRLITVSTESSSEVLRALLMVFLISELSNVVQGDLYYDDLIKIVIKDDLFIPDSISIEV